MSLRSKRPWFDINYHGTSRRALRRTCKICGNTIEQARILKSTGICEYCLKSASRRRDGVLACKGCGKVVPDQTKRYGGYCKDCICPACRKPDPVGVRKFGMCHECARQSGVLCMICGKEAPTQVSRNNGICDECARKGKE